MWVLIDAVPRFARTEPPHFDIIFFMLQHEVGGPTQALQPDQLERLRAAEAACGAVAAAVLR